MRWADKKVIVVGASSGIGREIALQLAAEGARVMAIARRTELLAELTKAVPTIQHMSVDVSNFGDASAAFDQACDRLGGLDAIFYCAGEMSLVGESEFDTQKDASMVEVNLIGGMAWLNPAAERFGAVGSGIIVGIGSVAGARGRKGQPAYNASKAGFHTYLESLRNRLWSKGVRVTTVMPGPVETAMTAHLDRKKMSARDAAKKIIALAPTGSERYLSLAHAVIFTVIKWMPSFVFRRLRL